MSTGYSWEGIRQVCATLLCARAMYLSASEVCYLGRYITCSTFTFTFITFSRCSMLDEEQLCYVDF